MGNESSCCEGQASRMLASLPEHVANFDLRAKEVYVDLYTSATISLAPLFDDGDGGHSGPGRGDHGRGRGAGSGVAPPTLTINTSWPISPSVTLELALPPSHASSSSSSSSSHTFGVQLRIPSWLATETTTVTLSNSKTSSKGSSKYSSKNTNIMATQQTQASWRGIRGKYRHLSITANTDHP